MSQKLIHKAHRGVDSCLLSKLAIVSHSQVLVVVQRLFALRDEPLAYPTDKCVVFISSVFELLVCNVISKIVTSL